MKIADLESKPVWGQDNNLEIEAGSFTLEIMVDDYLLSQTENKKLLLLRTIADYFASAMLDTGLPPTMWYIKFTEKAVRRFGFPEVLDMESVDDISSITLH